MNHPLQRYLSAACWIYLALLFGWLAVYLLTGDRLGLVSIVNMVAVYLFIPLPLVFAAALYLRRWGIGLGALCAAIVFIWSWGGLFLPGQQATVTSGDSLTVMTYNLLGWQDHTRVQIETIRQEDPDLVLLQELNPSMAAALQAELGAAYPYQHLQPAEGFSGMGVISKHPLRASRETLPLDWIGPPQVLEMDWSGREVTVINFHMQSSTLETLTQISADNNKRQAQAGVLADFARDAGPLIVGGDANATPLNETYRILTRELSDSWNEAGYGLGHTFPGSDLPVSHRPRLAGVAVPQWLVRIDYILHSAHWRAIAARTAQFDSVSDHRGVVVELVWSDSP